MTPTSRLKWCRATIRFWSVTDRVPSGLHLRHAGRIGHFALSPDGRQIASAHSDKTVRVWNIEPNNEYTKLPLDNPVDFCFAPTDRLS
jgi:WD40 repeat protein